LKITSRQWRKNLDLFVGQVAVPLWKPVGCESGISRDPKIYSSTFC
jgi:hypothetical protein